MPSPFSDDDTSSKRLRNNLELEEPCFRVPPFVSEGENTLHRPHGRFGGSYARWNQVARQAIP